MWVLKYRGEELGTAWGHADGGCISEEEVSECERGRKLPGTEEGRLSKTEEFACCDGEDRDSKAPGV